MKLIVTALVLALAASGLALAMTEFASITRAKNERASTAMLKTISTAEADFRSNDRDGNGVNDFWTADVYGLYALLRDGKPIRLIEESTALADARSRKNAYSAEASSGDGRPSQGYWIRAFAQEDDGDGPRLFANGIDVLRDRYRFAFIVFPDDLRAAKLAFVMNADNTEWKHNLPGTYRATVHPMTRDRNSISTFRTGSAELDDATTFPASPGAVGCSKFD